MKSTSTQNFRITKWISFIIHVFCITLFVNVSYAQNRNYATTATIKTAQVQDANNAANSTNSFAIVKSYAGIAGLGKYSGELELKFPTELPAFTTTYIKIGFNADVLNVLIGGNLGGALADLVGGIVLGDHLFEVGARNNSGSTILSGRSSSAFVTPEIRLLKDATGDFYVAITPNQKYDKVYIKDITDAVLGVGTNQTLVYNAFYINSTPACSTAFVTGFEGDGVTIDVLGVAKAGVTNAERAIDADINTFSEISLGAVGLNGSISQNIYFSSLSKANDELSLRLRINPALLNLEVAKNITVSAYNGSTQVYSASLNSVLSLDLLGLLNTGQPTTIPFGPMPAFNNIKITLQSLASVGVVQTISVYHASSSAARATFIPPNSNTVTVCYNTSATLTATTSADNELRWYDVPTGGTALSTVAYNAGYVTDPLTADKTFYVAARRLNCTDESIRVPITVTVNPLVLLPSTTLTNANVGTVYSKQINAATGGTPGYTYSVTAGNLPAGIILSSSGQIGGTPTASGDYSFSITATDTKGCTATTAFTLKVTPALVMPAKVLPNGTVGSPYVTQVIPAATGGNPGYTYAATNLPLGLSFNSATREITGTPQTAGNYAVIVSVQDADGVTAANTYNIAVKPALVLPTAPLSNGIVGAVYQTQTLLPASGGTGPYIYSISGLPNGLLFNETTREITGTPTTAGTATVTLTVVDAENRTTTATYTLTVVQPLALAAQSLPSGMVNVAYSGATLPAATGGIGTYTYVATGLPPGLNFNTTTREITGTPSQSGNYTITLSVTDQEPRTISNTYSLSVIGALSLPTATLADGTFGQVYTPQTLPAVTGGTGPYTYAATNLPPGLNFNTTTRQITGTPALGGVYTVSVVGTDANNNKVNTDYTININVIAPTALNATICSGTSTAINVNNFQAGLTYNLYGPTGNTPLATNNTGLFNTSALTATTTFYLEAVSGTASSTRTPITITINPAPTQATITTANQVVNSGQSTVLQAAADAGNTINWYGLPSGGTVLGTGPSFTTPNLNTTTTFYAETVNANQCVSATRAAATVTVINNGVDPNCNYANSQNSGITGICVLCSISNAGNSTDADLNNFTRITLAVGVGATGYQRLIFPNTGAATDSIRLDLATPTGLLDLGVLNGVTVNVMLGSTVVNSYQLNSALVNLSLLQGNRFRATLLAGGVYDRVEVRFGATVAALTSLDIYSAEIIYPKPNVATSGLTICSGNSTTLTASPNGGTTLIWYSLPSGGAVLANGNSYTTPVLTNTTTYYIAVSKNNCENLTRIPVTVTVVPVLTVPVVAATTPICAGSTQTLSVSNPDPAITYRWYDVAVGGSILATGTTFTTPALTATKNYYVEAAQLGCVSATRATVTVNVNQRPAAPQIQVSASNVGPNQTAILTASSSEPNTTFNWYTAANATAPVYTGTVFVTPPLTSTTSYFVESVNTLTGCTSVTRVQVTITVNTNVPNPVPCEAPIAQSNGVSGIALFAGVSNAPLAIDNDSQTASTLVMPVGVAAYVYQRLEFPSVSHLGDTVKVKISVPGKLLEAGVLSNIQLSTLNDGVANPGVFTFNDPLINLQLLSGDTEALVSFVPTALFNTVEIRLNSGLVGALSAININYAQHVLAAPAVVAASVAVDCTTKIAVLNVDDPKADLTYKWYDAAGVYQVGKDGTSFTTPVINANTRYFVAASSATGCTSTRTAVEVTTIAAPLTPELLFPTINSCAGSDVILEVKNPLAGLTYRWYDENNVYLAGKDGASLTVNAVTTNTSYAVEAVNSCGVVSGKAIANIVVGTVGVPIVTPTAVSVTAGSAAALTASSSTAGAIFNWYVSTAPNTIVYTGATYVTPPITTTTTYLVEAVAPGPCPPSARASVTVTVVPDGTPTTVPCDGATIAAADGVTGVAPLAGVFNAGLAVDAQMETGSSLVIPVGLLNASVFQRVGFASGLSHVGDTLRLSITSPGKLLSLAVLPMLSVTTFNGATSNGDAMLVNNPLIDLQLLSDNSAVILTYVPTLPFDGVELRLTSGLLGALTSVNFNYAQRIILAPQVTAATASICSGSSAALSVKNPVAGVVYRWYLESTYQADGATFNTSTGLIAGTYNFYVKAFANNCESAGTKVTVTVLGPPAAPIPSGSPTRACVNTPLTLSVNPISNVSFNWYDSNGNLLAFNNNTYTVPATLAAGTYDFFVEAVNSNGCSSATRTTITVTIDPSATAAAIQVIGNMAICSGSTTRLTASSSTVNTPQFIWYNDPLLTSVAYTGAVFDTPALLATTTYYVTVSGIGTCANQPADAKAITITVNPSAVASDITLAGLSTFCAGSSALLTASSTTVINPIFRWYTNSNLTGLVATTANFNTGPLSGTITYFVTVSGDNKCENKAADAESITLTVNPLAVAADVTISGNTKICSNSAATLTASSTTVTNPIFTWYSDVTLNTVAYTGATFTTPNLTGNKVYYVTVKGDNKCESNAANAQQVSITVNDYATAADITLDNATICAGSSTTLRAASFTVTNPVFTWYDDASLTVVVYTGPSYVTPFLTADKRYYVTVKGDNKCENTPINAKIVDVTVNDLSVSADLIVNGNTTICSGAQATLTAQSPTVSNPVFTWFADANLTNLVSVGSTFTSPSLTANATYYVTVSGDNKCANSAATAKAVLITVNNRPINPVVATAGTSICAGNATTLTVQNAEAGVIYEWYDNATAGTLVHTGETYTTPILTSGTVYYLQARNAAGCTAQGGRLMVTVTVTAIPAAPTVNANSLNVCIGSTATLSVTNPVTGITYSWFTTPTNGTAVFTASSFTTPAITADVIYYVQANAGNCISTTRTPVAITAMAVPLAPPGVTAAASPICAGNTVLLSVTNPDPNLNYRWYANSSGGTSLNEGITFTTPVLNTPTTYYVESVAKVGGCASNTRTPIAVNVLPVLVAPTVMVQATTANSITFTWNAVNGATGYEVSLNNGITWMAPSAGPLATSYVVLGLQPAAAVTLVVRATGQLACQTSATSTPVTGTSANPFANELFVPNTFTPNGDGKNDVFFAYGNLVAKFRMRVYNQWGEYLFESVSLTNGWDGRYKGNIQPNGVYVYYIDVTFNDGENKLLKGTITLLR